MLKRSCENLECVFSFGLKHLRASMRGIKICEYSTLFLLVRLILEFIFKYLDVEFKVEFMLIQAFIMVRRVVNIHHAKGTFETKRLLD